MVKPRHVELQTFTWWEVIAKWQLCIHYVIICDSNCWLPWLCHIDNFTGWLCLVKATYHEAKKSFRKNKKMEPECQSNFEPATYLVCERAETSLGSMQMPACLAEAPHHIFVSWQMDVNCLNCVKWHWLVCLDISIVVGEGFILFWGQLSLEQSTRLKKMQMCRLIYLLMILSLCNRLVLTYFKEDRTYNAGLERTKWRIKNRLCWTKSHITMTIMTWRCVWNFLQSKLACSELVSVHYNFQLFGNMLNWTWIWSPSLERSLSIRPISSSYIWNSGVISKLLWRLES